MNVHGIRGCIGARCRGVPQNQWVGISGLQEPPPARGSAYESPAAICRALLPVFECVELIEDVEHCLQSALTDSRPCGLFRLDSGFLIPSVAPGVGFLPNVPCGEMPGEGLFSVHLKPLSLCHQNLV